MLEKAAFSKKYCLKISARTHTNTHIHIHIHTHTLTALFPFKEGELIA